MLVLKFKFSIPQNVFKVVGEKWWKMLKVKFFGFCRLGVLRMVFRSISSGFSFHKRRAAEIIIFGSDL